MVEKGRLTEAQVTEAKASAKEGVRLSLMDDAQAAAEVAPYLNAFKDNHITFNGLVNKVKDVAGKYPNATWPVNFLRDNYEDESEEDFINRLKWTISNYAIEEEKDYSVEKQIIEETFGGIWIDDTEEFVKFVSAVNTYPKDENGDGISFTDNYFYAYYINTSNDAIPYVEVYLNGKNGQKYINEIIKNGENRTAREWAYWVNENFWDAQNQNNDFNSGDQSATSPQEDGGLDSKLPRFGRYYYTPELYSKVKRADSGSTGRGKINYSLITPEMDADYLSAVERGDMEKAQQMVVEAAKLAMPNTKVVDEDGNPKVVYHQTNHSAYINRETGQNWDELDWRERMEWDERDDWDEYWEEQEFNTFSRVNARTTNEFDGFFFAPEYDEYHEYGNRTIEAFLNIENPASNGDYYIDSSKNNAGREERIRLQNEGYDGVMENFFGIMKSELRYLHQFSDMEVFKGELRKYINYYNNDRIKLKLNGKSSAQYRTLYQ